MYMSCLCMCILSSQHLSIFTVLFAFCLRSLAEKCLLKKAEAQPALTNLPTCKHYFDTAEHYFLALITFQLPSLSLSI